MGVLRPDAAGSGNANRSGSSAGPEAAARGPVARIGRASGRPHGWHAGPGEDRHLTRGGSQYAPGSAGQGVGPQGRHLAGLPRGERGVWGAAPRFTGHRDATSMARQGQPAGPSDGFTVAQSSGFAKRRVASRWPGVRGLAPEVFRPVRSPINLIQGTKVPQALFMRLSEEFHVKT